MLSVNFQDSKIVFEVYLGFWGRVLYSKKSYG